MADERFPSNGNVTVWIVPVSGIANFRAPTAAEINAGINITPAVAWENTTFPTASESNDIDDRSLLDAGNATSRGFAQWEASLSLFRPKDLTDTVSDYGKAWQALKTPRAAYYVVTRVGQMPTGTVTAASAGDFVSVYRILTDAVADDIEGEDSYKYSFVGLPQGELEVYTRVVMPDPVVVTALGSTTLTAGDVSPFQATIDGEWMTQDCEWSSDDTAVATVSNNGVVTAVATGTADITATHPSATGATIAVSVTVS